MDNSPLERQTDEVARELAPGATLPALSDDDRAALGDLDKKAAVVRDRVRSVALGFRSALYLWGPGGGGKSFLVRSATQEVGVPFILYNGRMTGRALFDVVESHPEAVHVIEDMERLVDDRDAQAIIRSATGGEDGADRIITWSTVEGIRRFQFKGGLIVISNTPLADRPVLQAIATRLNPMEWKPTERELAALMRSISLKGYSHVRGQVSPGKCLEVADYLIEHAGVEGRHLDLRLLFHAYLDYIQWQRGQTSTHWHDLVSSMVWQLARGRGEPMSRAARKKWEQDLIAEISGETGDRHAQIRRWSEETGKSEKAFYRRLKEVIS